MRSSLRHMLTLLFALLTMVGLAQEKLPKYIAEDLELEQGVYLVEGVVYARKNTTLTINEGTTLQFKPNAVLRIDGGLQCKGSPNNLVNVVSINKDNPGTGIVINGVANQKSVDIQYTRFLHIKKPVSFEFRWGRKSVNFMHNVVKYSHFEGAAIQVKEIDNLLIDEKINFNLKRNTFSNNTSSILISNITSDLLTINLEDNVITQTAIQGKNATVFLPRLYLLPITTINEMLLL